MRGFIRRTVQVVFWTATASLLYVAMAIPAAINMIIFGAGD